MEVYAFPPFKTLQSDTEVRISRRNQDDADSSVLAVKKLVSRGTGMDGYHTLLSPRLYWSLDADVGVELVAKAMSRDRFEEILRFLPSTDNQALNKDDKRAKIRPLMNHLNTKFAMAYPMDQHISLDEAMIEYFSRQGCKQCIQNKPVRFGFKAWCLNSPLGYLATFDVYQGTALGLNRHYEERFGKGGDTLMILFEKLPSHIKIYQ
ncbi:piggyBac transposable element-derived protein 3-like [Palaemon carinicauda]|uniref:piggyBac transposable element-derived protein 3-like n=1 Tax=Palaemon carinicauda TaxID=392227 RepID=UPI0035B66907